MRTTRFVAVVCAASLVLAVPTEGQERSVMTEQEAVQALSGNDLAVRDRAVGVAMELGREAGSELRAALVRAALEEVRGETGRPDTGEAAFEAMIYYANALAPLREPGAVPFFLEMIGFGTGAANALADIGAAALPGVLKVVTDPGDPFHEAPNALDALRFMVEDGWPGPHELAAIREVARGYLTGKQGRMRSRAISSCMFLAVTLGDPELLAIVDTLASDPSAVDGLLENGDDLSRESTIESIQDNARGLLSGMLTPLPKRRPWSE